MAAPNREVFDLSSSMAQMPSFELPNKRIEAKVQLTKDVNSKFLKTLQYDLKQHNMDRVSLDPDIENAIIVTGIPPVNGFDGYTVLAIVKRRDPQATLLSPTTE